MVPANAHLARSTSLMKRAATPAFVLARVFMLPAPGRLRLSAPSGARGQFGGDRDGCFVQQATILPPTASAQTDRGSRTDEFRRVARSLIEGR